LQRLGAKVSVMCLTVAKPPDAAEAPRVAETQLSLLRERGDQMRVRFNRLGGGFYCQSAGHSQVNAEGAARVEADENLFTATCDAGDAPAFEERRQISV